MWFDVERQNLLTQFRELATVPAKVFLTYFFVDNETVHVVWGVSVHDKDLFDQSACTEAERRIRNAYARFPHILTEVHFHLDTSPH